MGELSTVDRSRLRTLERVIEEGIETFVRVGVALAEVKTARLYRDDHDSWSTYCEARWGFSSRHADRLIEASETTQRVIEANETHGSSLEPPKNERQARELARAPEDEQVEVWEEVTFDDPNPTAAKIRDAVEKRREPKPILEQRIDSDVDPVVERARSTVPELVRKLRFNLGNLGAGGRFDAPLAEIEEFAR